MPLPTGGAWPPAKLAPVYDKLATWSAWYGGDPEQLASVYGGAADQTQTGFFASQAGGFKATVRNALQRWFWGAQVPRHEQRTKLHVPIAGDIASTSADLLFSEPPSFTVEHAETQDRLTELVEYGLHATLLEAAEIGSALGGVYLRICWDREVEPDQPWIAAVHADAAVPEWQYGRLTAVTFWEIISDDGTEVVRHLERHEPGAILHGVYVGTRDDLGRRVALTDIPETEGLAESITDDGDTISTGVDQLTARYIPNIRPNRIWRTVPAAAYCGRSDYAGVEPLMDALDEVYSSWMRDIRLAKARLLVPETYLQSQGRGQGAVFETEQEIYSPVNALVGNQASGLAITPNQFAIRVTEHRDSALQLREEIVRGAGYSAQTFGATGDVAMTATETTARERKSLITRAKKENYWRAELRAMVEVWLAIDATVFGSPVEPSRPDIEFGDYVAQDANQLAGTLEALTRAESASTDTRVRMLHPDWDDDQVAEEIERIRDDSTVSLPPVPFGPDGGPPEDMPPEEER
jgi:hypothetical protein